MEVLQGVEDNAGKREREREREIRVIYAFSAMFKSSWAQYPAFENL